MNGRLHTKIALITGGTGGIGKDITKLFIENGAKVVIVDILDHQDYKEKHGTGDDYLKLDVSKESSWQKIYDHIKNKYNTLDILINNAGISGINEIQDPENMSIETWNHIHSVNLTSVFLGCKYGINMMKNNKQQCSIVNISSRSGVIAIPNLAAYSSAKAAIRNYTKAVAIYCAKKSYNIRCNTISPAAINTDMWAHYKADKKKFELFTNSLPLKRMGTAIEVAYAALYLASDESLYTTGSEIIIDGGILSTCGNTPK